jgi:acyl-CoA synthetase (AMP-forming)/AMP-acid ligase II
VGELVLRSAATCDGYWNDPAATDEVLRDGWLHTADLARFDAAGCVRLAGRRREMYIRGGYNVAPADVEAVLGDHPAVASIAIAPRPDPVMGEIGVAVVVAQSDERPTLASLRAFGAERLARWKLPEDLVVVDELPLTPMHKPDRRRLAELANANANANANGDDVGRADSA